MAQSLDGADGLPMGRPESPLHLPEDETAPDDAGEATWGGSARCVPGAHDVLRLARAQVARDHRLLCPLRRRLLLAAHRLSCRVASRSRIGFALAASAHGGDRVSPAVDVFVYLLKRSN